MKRVLVVEDDAALRETVAEILADAGYAVSSAGNGKEALASADVERPDVILLDLMMPTMNGWQFRAAQRQRPTLAQVPVIVVSACSDMEGEPSLGDVAALFAKPFDIGELLAGIRLHAGG
ncbi:MAG: response regulator transcription factor [Deltaproteobacteria bacterium]|nr:response regulator transcription factor [Deltaproteobacteria bacterium]